MLKRSRRYDDQASLSFGRLLAVGDGAERDDPYWLPEYWKVELDLVFAEDPAGADFDGVGFQNTGFDHTETGGLRTASLGETRRFLKSYPQLAAMWRAEPVRSEVTLDQAG